MKKKVLLLLVFFGMLASCLEKDKYSSSLDGVYVDNQELASGASKAVIEVNSSLTGVYAKAIDLSTNALADWLTVDISPQTITITATENITVADRSASVTLYTISGYEDDSQSTVVFYVTQKKNTQFEGLNIEEVIMGYQQGDTIIAFNKELSNIKTDAVDLEGRKCDWLKTEFRDNRLAISVSEFLSQGHRQAMVCLSAVSKDAVADSLMAKVSFLVTQNHNPVLDSLVLSPLVFNAESSSQVIHTGRPLTAIRAKVIDDKSAERASWCTAAVAGDSVTVNVQAHSLQSDRTATVTLYLPNKGETIDSTTIILPFTITQKHNNIFDGADFNNRTVKWNQQADTLKLTRDLKDISCQLIDTLTLKSPSWIQAKVEGKQVVFKVTELNTVIDRTAQVTLYISSGNNSLKDETVQTSFYVTQQHNNIFDGVQYKDRMVTWNQKVDTLKLTRELTNIQCKLTDLETGNSPNWLKATVNGKMVCFSVDENKSKKERSATVTLYLPDGGKLTDESVQTTFRVSQSGNNIFSEVEFKDQTMKWNEISRELDVDIDLSQIRSRVIDNATSKTAAWLNVSLNNEDKLIKFSLSQLTTIEDRSATVTLYVPTNGSTIDDNTEQVSFKVTQQHYNIFDNVQYHNRTVAWNQKTDTLKLTRELIGIQCKLTDNSTGDSPNWLSASVKEKTVVFTVQPNQTLSSRSATVLLYLPNGSTIDEHSVKTSLQFEQGCEEKATPEKKSVEVNYQQQNYKLNVTSNTDYTMEAPSWVTCTSKSEGDFKHVITLSFGENTDNEVRVGELRLTREGELLATVALKQRTNPHIEVNFPDGRKVIDFGKGGGEIQLPVKTLTPNYRITRKEQWISIGRQEVTSYDQYYHKLTIQSFVGKNFERRDTLMIFNSEDTLYFPVQQNKYVYLSEAKVELEVGHTLQLEAFTNTGRPFTWKTGDARKATVAANGSLATVTAIEPGSVRISASIGVYDGVSDYNDYCDVAVYDVRDKVAVTRVATDEYYDYEQRDGYVTSQCPVVITNNYTADISITSLKIKDNNGNVVAQGNLGLPFLLKAGASTGRVNLTQALESAYRPQIEVEFTCNGNTYTKKVSY